MTCHRAEGTYCLTPMPPDERHLLDLLKLHSEEVRFQVQLNWDRAKSSLTFHVALLALTATLDKVRPVAPWLFLFTAMSACLCAGMLHISHRYYRAARDRRREVEKLLGTQLGFVTTPGMAKDAQAGLARYWPKVNTILLVLHAMVALLCLGAALSYARD